MNRDQGDVVTKPDVGGRMDFQTIGETGEVVDADEALIGVDAGAAMHTEAVRRRCRGRTDDLRVRWRCSEGEQTPQGAGND